MRTIIDVSSWVPTVKIGEIRSFLPVHDTVLLNLGDFQCSSMRNKGISQGFSRYF